MSVRLGGITCDRCNTLVVMNGLQIKDYLKVIGKKGLLYYCSEDCKKRHFNGKLKEN